MDCAKVAHQLDRRSGRISDQVGPALTTQQVSQFQGTAKGGSSISLESIAKLIPDDLPRLEENIALPPQESKPFLWSIAAFAKTLGLHDVLSRTAATTDLFLSHFRTMDLPSIESPVTRRKLQEHAVLGTTSLSEPQKSGTTEYKVEVEFEVATNVGTSFYKGEPRDRTSYETRADFWEGFECDALFREPRPIHNASTWAFLRGIYLGVVGSESTLQDSPYSLHGFQKSVIVKQSPGKGRGVFANEFIAKGELIWITAQEARFHSGEVYRRFLASVPDDLVCDVMQLTYIQETDESLLEGYPELYSEKMIAVDLDEGGLVNADWETNGDAQNIGYYRDLENADEEGPWFSSTQHYVALTDIQPGEELISSYDEVSEEEWRDFGI